MSGGAKKPKDVPISEGEKIQTQLAKDQIAYYRSTYAPLESQFRDEASRDYSSRFAGQNATASTRLMTPALADTAKSVSMADTASLGDAITSGRVSGMGEGRRQRDDGALEALGVGLGVTADAGTSLSQAGRIQTNAAIDKTTESIVKMQAKADVRNAAIGAVASVAGAYGTNKLMGKMEAKQAAAASSKMGASRDGYSAGALSGWKGPSRSKL
jgi:hypothetical protein